MVPHTLKGLFAALERIDELPDMEGTHGLVSKRKAVFRCFSFAWASVCSDGKCSLTWKVLPILGENRALGAA